MAQQQNKPQTQQDLNQLLKVRREKLAALQEAGNDPFEITKYDQTHHSDEVKELYTAHEEKLLAGRAKPDTEGMDEAEARKVINDDYNERRAIMDASPIQVSVAGRMMFKRVMGKASFCNIQDLKGKIQIYVSRDSIGDFHTCRRIDIIIEITSDFTREVPWSYRYRCTLSSEIY